MSFFIGNMVIKTVNNLKSKAKYVKTQYKIYENEKVLNKNNTNYTHPRYIKANPYYLADKLKSNFEKFLKYLYDNFKNRPKQITFENNKNVPIILVVNKITNYSKKAALTIVDTVNYLILKVTGGFLDVKKVMSTGLTPIVKNFSLIIINNLNYQNLLIIYKKMGNSVNKYKKETMGYLSKYRDPKAFEEFKNQYDIYLRKMSDQVKNKNVHVSKFNIFINKFYPSTFFNLKTMTNSQIHKVNKFIKSPWYKQKYYTYEYKLKQFFEKTKSGNYFKYTFYKEKVNKGNLSRFVENLNYSNAKNYFTGGMKRQMKKILFYIVSFFIFYYSVKYFIHRLFDRKHDKSLEEALRVVNDIKLQNEELMKYNRELIDKIIDDRRKK